MVIPFEEYERAWIDLEEAKRSVGAFLYAALATGRLGQADAEALANLVEDLNLEKQRELFVLPHLVYYAQSLADRILVPLCDHEGDHEVEEWPARQNN